MSPVDFLNKNLFTCGTKEETETDDHTASVCLLIWRYRYSFRMISYFPRAISHASKLTSILRYLSVVFHVFKPANRILYVISITSVFQFNVRNNERKEVHG
jgi:hypothetical protein